jgi:formamidopyrimidine-DNA glycosylase
MPELPEVEHARARTDRWWRRERIEEARSFDALVVVDAEAFEALRGAIVEGVHRCGKHLLLRTTDGRALWFHLGMTGHVQALPASGPIAEPALPRFTRWALRTPRRLVVLTDPRRLGRAHAGPVEAIEAEHVGRLGPEATDASPALLERILDTKLALKAALMDQARLAGLGNIHAAEALFLAGLHPERPSRSLRPAERERLAAAIREALARAAVPPDEDLVYVNEGGPNPFLVYGREGQPCTVCGAAIGRVTTAGRSTYFCPRCQPRRPKSPAPRR